MTLLLTLLEFTAHSTKGLNDYYFCVLNSLKNLTILCLKVLPLDVLHRQFTSSSFYCYSPDYFSKFYIFLKELNLHSFIISALRHQLFDDSSIMHSKYMMNYIYMMTI